MFSDIKEASESCILNMSQGLKKHFFDLFKNIIVFNIMCKFFFNILSYIANERQRKRDIFSTFYIVYYILYYIATYIKIAISRSGEHGFI